MSQVSHISEVMPDLVGHLRTTRVPRQARRPDLTDVFGRVWTWVAGDLYRHDSMTWTKKMVESPSLRGPSADALTNTNYVWCDRCREVARP